MAVLANSPPMTAQFGAGVLHPEAHQGISAAQVMVEEGQGRPHGEAVEPQGHLGELHGQEVLVHSEDASS